MKFGQDKNLFEFDPVFKMEDGLWYFWDETWAFEHGPFDSEDEAREELKEYCDQLNEQERLKYHE